MLLVQGPKGLSELKDMFRSPKVKLWEDDASHGGRKVVECAGQAEDSFRQDILRCRSGDAWSIWVGCGEE